MSAEPKPYLTEEEYLAIERVAPTKSEYYRGEMFAMAGASLAHNQIVSNLIQTIGPSLRGRRCAVLPSDMRVRVPATGLYTYPDVIIVCDNPQLDTTDRDVLLNPKVIFEVLSDTTEAYDRGRKFEHYAAIPSLQEYVLVSRDEPRVERFTRQEAGGWLYVAVSGLESVAELLSVPCHLPLAEVFEGIAFQPAGGADEDRAL